MNKLLATYDYIIAGGGMSGLSLGYYLSKSSLKDKTILIIDKDAKNKNDHTWCFWEKDGNTFDEIVFKRWNKIWFHGTNNFSEVLELDNYEYKMIKGIDFYTFIIPFLKQNPNIHFLQADILGVIGDDKKATVKTSNGIFEATEYAFDSQYKNTYNHPKNHNLKQHFLGWIIDTKQPVFTEKIPTLFDFRVDQKNECRFIYILPENSQKALIEFTIFSEKLIKKEEYEYYLKEYITQKLHITDFTITKNQNNEIDEEYGIIPMSDFLHDAMPYPHVIRIGTSGGFVKASSGYSFLKTQHLLQEIVADLEKNQFNKKHFNNNWKHFLDSVLLNVMLTNKAPSDEIFTAMFSKNKASAIFKFLDEESTLLEDIQMMKSLPTWAFTKGAISSIKRKLIGQ
ncbi:MAG: lycopene cyclase [Pseudarcicella sp.]|nr:lycopene cyclase [Pseudarcicella sp.]MBP6409950.1 lycopene cyclase [Pseudarcicella sp.]